MAKNNETIEATATEVAPEANGTPEAQTEAPQLGVGDLQNAAQIIDGQLVEVLLELTKRHKLVQFKKKSLHLLKL